MTRQPSSITAAALLALAGHAVAGPGESVMFTAVPTNGLLNSAANSVRTHPFVGGFPLGRIDLVGSLTAVHPQTWRTDSRLLITAPNGTTSAIFQPFTSGTTFTTLNFDRSLYLPAGTNPAGVWSFRFYEAFDDGGTAAVDANWTITITLTANPPPAPVAVDLGALQSPGTGVSGVPIAPGQVLWYRFTVPALISAGTGRYLDVDTFGSSLPPAPAGGYPDDTAIGVYDGSGALVAGDDDSGDGFTSQLTFGAGTRPGRGDGLPFDGRNGALAPGLYYLAAGGYPMTLGPFRWEATSTSVQPGVVTLGLRTNLGGPCYANCDASTTQPVLNVADFGCFLNRFAAGEPYANCDGSTIAPTLNILDFACYLNAFAAGCP